MKAKKILLSIIAITVLIIGTVFCVNFLGGEEEDKIIKSLSDLEGGTIAVQTGSIYEDIIDEYIEDVELIYADMQSDLCTLLETSKVDAFMTDEPIAENIVLKYEDFQILDRLSDKEYGFIFNKDTDKGVKLCDQMNEFIVEHIIDGTLNTIYDRWIISEHPPVSLDFSGVTDDSKEKLTLAVSSDVGAPFCYLQDDGYVGLDIDVAIQFCEEYGYSLEIVDYSFSGLISAVQGKKADFGAAGVIKTEERAEKILFSNTYCTGSVVVVTKRSTLTVNDLSNQSIGCLTGTIEDIIAAEEIENPTIFYCDTNADTAVALENGKVKAIIIDAPVYRYMKNEYPDFISIKNIRSDNYGFIFDKGDEGQALCSEFNEFLYKCYLDGTINEIDDIWFGTDEEAQEIDFSKVKEGKNGTLRLCTSTSVGAPFAYLKDGEYAGYEIDIAVRFCEAYGYGLEILDTTFSAVLSAVQGGKADFGAALITITEERSQKIQFSTPHYVGGLVLVVKDEGQEITADAESSSSDFWSDLKDSFNSTFVVEGRWKLFLEGIGNTLIITILTIILGSLLGFGFYWLSRNTGAVFTKIFGVFSSIITGMPVVVLLMILFYIIFVNVNLSGMVVSIIGFTLIFSSNVFSMLRTSVETVSNVQNEAALALGFTENQSFFKIILPQSLGNFLPTFRAEVVTHIKATAVVGYVAVQDLTKMSDIIRSRTYEAFFPLIVSAIIYFVIEFILISIVKSIQINTDNRKRSHKKIMKGIELK